ncbi:MAG: DUF4153 domain-containing protein [Gemmatimonadota bacterium]
MTAPTAAAPTIRARGVAAVLSAARLAIQRFPLVVGAGILATAGASVLIGQGHHPDALRVLAVATLALPLLFTVTVLAAHRPQSMAHWVLLVAGLLGLAAFWRIWPHWGEEMRAMRYAQLSATLHLLAAFAPFIGAEGTNGFWQYNKALFLRGLTAAIYAGVLYVGLAIALAALDKLFGVNVIPETYGRLWFFLAFVFATMIFVAGVPDDLDALATQYDYPNGLRAFTQFVLVPLVAIYLVILTIYLVKVLVTQQWPSGWIGYLVSSVAVAGILSWLLVQPLEERPEFAWVKPFTRGFYIALMPAIVMLWLAIWQRVQQYGITERRYGLIVLSVWLAAIAVYYTQSRSRNIKLIPATLCVVIIGTYAGPTGAYSVARRSQMGRLQQVLERNSLIAGGKLQRATNAVPDSDRVAISAGFQYLTEVHGYQSVAAWLPDSLLKRLTGTSDSVRSTSGTSDAAAIMTTMNLAYTPVARGTGTTRDGSTFIYFGSSGPPASVPIAGYTHAVRIRVNPVPRDTGSREDSVVVDDHTVVRLTRETATLHVMRNGASLLDIPLQSGIDSAAAAARSGSNNSGPAPALRIEATGGEAGALVYVTLVNGTEKAKKLKISMLNADLYLRLPR